ncbi:MAG: type III-B CRISPR module-associated protein Cmr5 [Chloroflexota bacterium]|nr:type III-B CRISPR module-associated protein Cmr5 [Chloroflexota bacterium]
MPSSNIRTLEQERARQAWDNVQEVKVRGQSYEGEYKSLVKGTPALILTNGLIQTLAFLESKKKPHHLAVVRHLSGWVCQQLKLTPNQLGKELREGDSVLLRLATQESLAYLQWLRRFAEATIEKEVEEH